MPSMPHESAPRPVTMDLISAEKIMLMLLKRALYFFIPADGANGNAYSA